MVGDVLWIIIIIIIVVIIIIIIILLLASKQLLSGLQNPEENIFTKILKSTLENVVRLEHEDYSTVQFLQMFFQFLEKSRNHVVLGQNPLMTQVSVQVWLKI